MANNLDKYFDKKHDGGRLSLAGVKKSSVLRLPEILNGTPGRKLSGDKNQCPSCGEYFNSFTAFDKHRVGSFEPNERRCLTVAEMQINNFGKTKDDFWLCPVSQKDRERINQIRSKRKKTTTVKTVWHHYD